MAISKPLSKKPDNRKARHSLAAVQPSERHIHVVRGRKVMLDFELAALYGIEPRALLQAVRRNTERFPEDFMLSLSPEEAAILRSQSVITSKRPIKYQLFAFTELGVAMLSSVLRSVRAIQMNILIMRTFVRLREMLATHKDLAARIEKLEHGQKRTSSVIEILVEDIDRLVGEVRHIRSAPAARKRKIGFEL